MSVRKRWIRTIFYAWGDIFTRVMQGGLSLLPHNDAANLDRQYVQYVASPRARSASSQVVATGVSCKKGSLGVVNGAAFVAFTASAQKPSERVIVPIFRIFFDRCESLGLPQMRGG
jgi:hypothetical protein